METKLFKLIQEGKFVPAVNVLKEELMAGNILDPRFDSVWASLADRILEASNPRRCVHRETLYWIDWFKFFLEAIEPKWGHAHKGHIYFRLGFSYASVSNKTAVANFRFAQNENKIFCEKHLGYRNEQITNYCREQSSYVALCLLERMDLLEFKNNLDRKLFIRNLFSEAFDRVIRKDFPSPQAVIQSILALSKNDKTFGHSEQVYRELQTASTIGLTYAIIALTGSVLETVLYNILDGKLVINNNGEVNERPTLWDLYFALLKYNVYPNDIIKASCRLISYLRNRIHSTNTLNAEHPLTLRASLTIKTLLEITLIEWARLDQTSNAGPKGS